MVANIDGTQNHLLMDHAVEVLVNLGHRGACGCDPETGDGAGILFQTPHAFFARVTRDLGFALPEAGSYGVGMSFLPQDAALRGPGWAEGQAGLE